ncbi:hypothetical protein PSTT_15258 [Puccinia striiformis]|uniref:proline--tRNA ligase n=1 Tax=Puccinia striiformis TaxID=27350 RepID=A0A2S4UIQ8_9BASI|nr:hypothetical protein PSTT_15258 [Puccinia striiformis]
MYKNETEERTTEMIRTARGTRWFSSTIERNKPANYQSKRYSPTIKLEQNTRKDAEGEDSLLVRAGFVRQSSSGIWSFLPNGLRVLQKIQIIIEKQMDRISTSTLVKSLCHSYKVKGLWERSGRWNQAGAELFRLKDRKGSSLLLSPTHEEEVTNLVKMDTQSGKQLPIKLYHIGRKFRDEARPRAGLLRSREFIMKDLYTFDIDPTSAIDSYKEVQQAYRRIFETIGIPFTVALSSVERFSSCDSRKKKAQADSGAIGGATSHEYHYKSTSNQELARSTLSPRIINPDQTQVRFFSSPKTLYSDLQPIIFTPTTTTTTTTTTTPATTTTTDDNLGDGDCFPKFDEDWDRMKVLVDQSCVAIDLEEIFDRIIYQFRQDFPPPSSKLIEAESRLELSPLSIWPSLPIYSVHDLRMVSLDGKSGQQSFEELCPDCNSPLDSSSAIEVGHTFYLGTKYSEALGLKVMGADPRTSKPVEKAVEMGCFGIGISRLVGAIGLASRASEEKGGGLRWPISVAPFKVCIVIPGGPDSLIYLDIANRLVTLLEENNTVEMKDDVLIDDRDQRIGWKLADAELVGYPILIILGNRWRTHQTIEIRNLLSASVASISIPPNPSAPSETDGLDLGPAVLHILSEIEKLTPPVS